MKSLDDLDKKILRLLGEDGRVAPATIAGRLGVTAPTVRARMKQLENAGLLKVAGLIDPCQTEGLTTALIGMNVRAYGKLGEVMEKLTQVKGIVSASIVTGRYDIIAEAVVEGGNTALYELTTKTIPELAVVDRSETFVVMASSSKWIPVPKGFATWGGEVGEGDPPEKE